MKLLIATQAVDTEDPVLGFFVRWIEEFARHAERVEVICLREGKHALPPNVRVHSLGKESGRAKRARVAQRFLSLAWRLRGDYDAVFVHMNPEYLVLAGWLWRLLGKPAALWYTHRSVDLKLRVAVLWASVVFTASRESFRLPTKKLRIVGHAIDAEQFTPAARPEQPEARLRILTAGRLSGTKRILEMLEALDVLYARAVPFSFTIAGVPATAADREYEQCVKEAVRTRLFAAQVAFSGAVAHADMPALLHRHDVFLNLSATGSMDKAVLEALAAGVPAVTANEAFRELLGPPGLYVTSTDASVVARVLETAHAVDVAPLTQYVRERFALDRTIETVFRALAERT